MSRRCEKSKETNIKCINNCGDALQLATNKFFFSIDRVICVYIRLGLHRFMEVSRLELNHFEINKFTDLSLFTLYLFKNMCARSAKIIWVSIPQIINAVHCHRWLNWTIKRASHTYVFIVVSFFMNCLMIVFITSSRSNSRVSSITFKIIIYLRLIA